MRKGARTDQPLRFPGQELAMTWEGTEENYNVFRWYRAGWGRYTQPDPMGAAGSLDTYGYVDGDPVNEIDPMGEVKHCIHASRTQYIGMKSWQHHLPKYTNPGPQYKYLFNLIIFDARCDDCHEKIDALGATLTVPPQYAGNGPFNARPLIMKQFTHVLSADAVEFDVSVSSTWITSSLQSTFEDLGRKLVLCYDCMK